MNRRHEAVLNAGGREYKEILEIENDPSMPASATTDEEWELMKTFAGMEEDGEEFDR